MKILNLQVQNVKKIRAIDITPKENTVIISGKNGNGKSSTMDSIAMLLGGKKLIPDKPVREGETTASIKADLGAFVVTRHWTSPDVSYLKLENKEGAKFSNAQSMLDAIVGELSFDPLAFTTIEPRKRLEILRQLTKLDFTQMDKEFHELTGKRRDIGRDRDLYKAQLDTEFVSVMEEEQTVAVNIVDVQKQRATAQQQNEMITRAKMERNNLVAQFDQLEKNIEATKKSLEDQQLQRDKLALKIGDENNRINSLVTIDITKFDQQIEQHYKDQTKFQKIEAKRRVSSKYTECKNTWDKLTHVLEEIIAKKQKMLSETKMPIEGLAFGDNEITYSGIPFGQLSQAEQIKISMAIATAMNPKLRVVMIYNGSLLDGSAMKFVQDFANEKDLQVWVERVAEGPDGSSVYIEDGAVVQ